MKLALVLVAALVAPAHAGPCDIPGLMAIVKTPQGATIDQFGGVVVAAVSFGPGTDTKDPVGKPWEFVEGKQRAKARITTLAPGLAVYAPMKPVAELDLEDKPGHSTAHVKFQFMNTDDMPVDSAPRPTVIVQAKRTPMMRSDVVTATLAEAPPAGTIAVLVRATSRREQRARSWQEITDLKALKIDVYRRDRCEALIPGTVPTNAGDKIELAWLDGEGHVSLWSTAIEVKAER